MNHRIRQLGKYVLYEQRVANAFTLLGISKFLPRFSSRGGAVASRRGRWIHTYVSSMFEAHYSFQFPSVTVAFPLRTWQSTVNNIFEE